MAVGQMSKPARKVTASEIGEGIRYVLADGYTANGITRRKRKPTLEELKRTQAACDRAQDASDKIRAAKGLDPIPPNFFRVALMEAIAEAEAKPIRMSRKRSRSKPVTAALESIPAPLRAELESLGKQYGFRMVAA